MMALLDLCKQYEVLDHYLLANVRKPTKYKRLLIAKIGKCYFKIDSSMVTLAHSLCETHSSVSTCKQTRSLKILFNISVSAFYFAYYKSEYFCCYSSLDRQKRLFSLVSDLASRSSRKFDIVLILF